MGNDQSKLKGIEIDKKAVEATDFWSLFNAEVPQEDGTTNLSIFQEEPVINGQLWVNQSPLGRAIKNLMIYRHPYILKYVTSWEKSAQKYLATERVQPLSVILKTQSDIQICLGLRNVLSSLIFLTEQAKARHLNICTSSIYVNIEGEWHLGGFEFVWKHKEVTKNLLDLAQPYRNKNSIDSNETKNGGEGLEQYSFASLCEEILKNSKNVDTPYVMEFRDYCRTHLKHQNVTMRPKLSAILLHPYFNHEFILIHSFLTELPLKNPHEKQDFFTGLIDRLRYFDENVVASQIGNLLLSRMVLLDTTAQLCVTPYVLKTRTDISAALFSTHTFTKFIIPRIKNIFCVRDAQIRLILLEYFNEYVKLLTKEELKEHILPNLLLGIKDTNDILVAKTLRCLADLVPILGSEVVIGGNRSRLFADGRPQGLPDSTSPWVEPRSITPVMSSTVACSGGGSITGGIYMASASPLPPDNIDASGNESYMSAIIGDNITENSITENNNNSNLIMQERLSPDGGEDVQETMTDGEIDDDAWSDWENNDDNQVTENENQNSAMYEENVSEENLQKTTPQNDQKRSLVENLDSLKVTTDSSSVENGVMNGNNENISSSSSSSSKKLQLNLKNTATSSNNKLVAISDDIQDLDIKIQKINKGKEDEFDFFKDMEPVIETKPNALLLDRIIPPDLEVNPSENIRSDSKKMNISEEIIQVDKSRFEFKIEDNDIPEVGWGDDDDNDWGST